jgi:hypothetical protein
MRAAVTVTLPRGSALEGIRYEQYYRFTGRTAGGFALIGERSITRYARLQAGYVTIDELYVGFPADRIGWNADRVQRGRRLVFYGTVPAWRELALAPYYTHAFRSPYAVALKNRFDFVVQYDVLARLRRAGAL